LGKILFIDLGTFVPTRVAKSLVSLVKKGLYWYKVYASVG